MDTMNVHQDSLVYFVDDPNLLYNFNNDHLNNDCFVDNNQLLPYPGSTTISSFSYFEEEMKGEVEGENDNGRSSSSATINRSTDDAKPRAKTDMTQTLVCERRRRGRMRDNLYALRALVPNITKMNKASIIEDAASYVHDLRAQAKKLKAEVAGLEASLSVSEKYQRLINNDVQVIHNINRPIYKKIMQVEMFQVEERGYFTKILCNKGEGVAASLYMALESLTHFIVQNSNLATICDNYLLTFTLNVKGCEPEINLPNLKLGVATALLNQGFEFMPSIYAQLTA